MSKIFHKMHSCGNDFIIADLEDFKNNLNLQFIVNICDRKYGVGCDQFILLKYDQSQDIDCEIIIYNSDGSVASFCGNGVRCVADLLFSRKFTSKTSLTIKSSDKIITLNKKNDHMIETNMGYQVFENKPIKIDQFFEITGYGFEINVGNPHIVFFVRDFNFDYEKIGHQISSMKEFPNGINVNFAQIINRNEILLQTYERGAGLTIACGSGSCATAFVAYKLRFIDEITEINFLHGKKNDYLKISINEKDEIDVIGKSNYIFEGRINF